jgi:hypothetical protein
MPWGSHRQELEEEQHSESRAGLGAPWRASCREPSKHGLFKLLDAPQRSATVACLTY